MSFIKRTIILLLVLLVFFVAVIAGSQNSDSVALRFLDWQTWEMPISFWMLGAFSLGIVLTYVFSLWGITKLKLQTRKANKQVDRAKQDLDKMNSNLRQSTTNTEIVGPAQPQ